MTCYLCVGFCESSALQRQSVSLFDGSDHELDQALVRSVELPDSRQATELRMFLLVEIGHILIDRKYQEVARLCDIEMLAETPWLKVRPVLSTLLLVERSGQLMDAIETFETLKFEGRLRRVGSSGHNTAELFSSGFLLEPLIQAVRLYGSVVESLIASLKSNTPSRSSAEGCGHCAVKMLHELGFMPQDYLTVLQYLHAITENETIDPWTTHLPFLG